MSMPALVYSLCVITSALCATLLLHAYMRTRTRLLLWSAISFICLAFNNVFVLADLIWLPEINLLALRNIAALAAVSVLIYAFIWEVE
jgi:hypothetical protein